MKQLHQLTAAADEDEHVSVADIGAHLLFDHADQRVDPLAHVRASRTQVVTHRIVQTEHGSQHALRQYFHQHGLASTSEVRPDAVGEGQRHSRQLHSGH